MKFIAIQNNARILKVLFVVLILLSIAIRLLYISDPIIDMHGFRQTQTAITVLYFLKEGLSLDSVLHYKTPVLGFPWMIPMEFPVYQISAYYIHRIISFFLNVNLETSLRITSLLFFYGSCYFLLKITELVTNRKIAIITSLLYLFSPFTIFWSRTSMIEFCAVFFSLGFVYYFLRYYLTQYFSYLILFLLFGAISFLAKITSVLPCCVFIALYYLSELYKNGKNVLSFIKNKKFFIYETVIVIFLLSIGKWWVDYSDLIKSKSEFTALLTSKNLSSWNFASPGQRTDFSVIGTILKRTLFHFSLTFTIIISILCLVNITVVNKKISYSLQLVICILSTLITMFTFCNLFYVHNYYYCSVIPFEAIGLGILIYNIQINRLSTKINKKNKLNKIRTTVIFILIISSIFTTIRKDISNNEYFVFYLKDNVLDQIKRNEIPESIYVANYLKTVDNNTKADSNIILLGYDWSSEIPFYSEKKTLMVTGWLDDITITDALKRQPDYTYLLVKNDFLNSKQINNIKQAYNIEELYFDNKFGFKTFRLHKKLD